MTTLYINEGIVYVGNDSLTEDDEPLDQESLLALYEWSLYQGFDDRFFELSLRYNFVTMSQGGFRISNQRLSEFAEDIVAELLNLGTKLQQRFNTLVQGHEIQSEYEWGHLYHFKPWQGKGPSEEFQVIMSGRTVNLMDKTWLDLSKDFL